MKIVYAALPLAAGLMATPALAELPDSTKAIIDAAIASGDPAKVATVIELAREVHPEDSAELDAIQADFTAKQQALAEQTAAEEEAAIRHAGIFDNWTGEGQVGAFRSTGNSSNTGIALGVGLERVGIDWRHKITALADFQRTSGVTTREQFLFAYEPNYQLNERLFVYGLGQYERDRFQGYSSRISASGGLGYRVIDEDNMSLAIKGGPAYRETKFVAGGSDSSLAALGALDFDWQVSDTIKFTEDASVFWQSGNTTLVSTTGVEAALGGSLSARLAYVYEHDTNPPLGAVKTDTLTRFTLVYGF